jgi:hypothetical protein
MTLRKTFIVTVAATSYIEVVAFDEQAARRSAARRLAREFVGPGRSAEIVKVEEG